MTNLFLFIVDVIVASSIIRRGNLAEAPGAPIISRSWRTVLGKRKYGVARDKREGEEEILCGYSGRGRGVRKDNFTVRRAAD